MERGSWIFKINSHVRLSGIQQQQLGRDSPEENKENKKGVPQKIQIAEKERKISETKYCPQGNIVPFKIHPQNKACPVSTSLLGEKLSQSHYNRQYLIWS